MKRIILFVSIMTTMLFIIACDMDPYGGRRPADREDSYWICEEDNIWFHVDQDGLARGVMVREDGDIAFTLLWSALDNGVMFVDDYISLNEHEYDYTALMDGRCKYALKRCEITVLNDYAGLYPEGELPILTFIMQGETGN